MSRTNPRGLIVTLYLTTFMVLLDVSIVIIAMPSMQSDLGATSGTLQWVMNAYTLCLATLALSAGALGDRYGRKRVFLTGAAVFTLGSGICAAAPTPALLIAGRFVQGVGAAMALPGTLALIGHTFTEPAQRAKVIGGWSTVAGVASLCGPVLGGLLVDAFGWPSIFLINLPIGLLVLLVGRRAVPESADPQHASLDPAGQLLGILWLGSLSFGLINAGEHGWSTPGTVAALTLGVVGLAAFLAVELRQSHPMLPVRLFADLRFTISNLTTLAFGFSVLSIGVFLPAYFQQVQHRTAAEVGLMMMLPATVAILVPPLTGRWVAKAGPRAPMAAGFTVAAAAMAGLLTMGPDTGTAVAVLILMVVNVGYALNRPASNTALMDSVTPERSGTAAAVNGAMGQIGTTLGIALLGTLLASSLTRAGGESAAQAHTDGLHLIAAVAGAVALASALVVAAFLCPDSADSADSADRNPRATSRNPVLALASGVWPRITGVTAVRVAVLACYLGQGVLLAGLLPGLLRAEGVGDQLTPILGIAALIAVRFALLWAADVLSEAVGHASEERLRARAFRQLAALGPAYTAGARSGEIREALAEGIDSLQSYYGRYLPSLAAGLLAPVVVVAILASQDVWLAVLVAVFALAALVLPPLWSRPLKARGHERMGAYLGLGAEFLDTLQGMVTLKTFGAAPQRRKQLAETSQRLTAQWVREMAVALVPGGIYALAITGGLAATAVAAAVRVAEHGLAAETMFLALFLTGEALRPIGILAGAFHQSYAASGTARRIQDLLDAPAAAPERPGAVERAGLAPRIAFEDVTFGYDNASAPVLKNFSLTIDQGHTVAVVGPSGAGKTTVVSLLLRFVDPQRGSVRIGGTDIRDLALEQLRRMIALVAQDTYLFGGTVRENLLMAKPDATHAEVEAAARTANAHDFISALPKGYDTVLGERGHGLSGGQRQRLAIARAVLSDAPILVLDEATSSVDAESEASIQAALDRVTLDRTTLVVAHRLSTVRGADRIVVLDHGGIAETGTHDELTRRGGAYARLIAAQEVPA